MGFICGESVCSTYTTSQRTLFSFFTYNQNWLIFLIPWIHPKSMVSSGIYIYIYIYIIETCSMTILNRPWRDRWMTGQMDGWMKWCFTSRHPLIYVMCLSTI
jgi:hypothetical protein